MISLLGRTAVLVGLAACSVGAVTGCYAGARKSPEAWRWTRWMAYVFGGSITVAVALMEWALITHDFSVGYVAEVGSLETPLIFSIVSLWSSLDGSILLWALILALYTAVFAWRTRDQHPDHTPWALGVTMAVGVFFTFLVSGVANPFEPVSPVPTNGPGPNPLLQNHVLMIIHPPMLYLGYVGMSVPFGMGAAALLSGRLPTSWTRALRRWMLLPWGCLTVGIILGGWWSYEVLGWGGYWAWDPVENASFLPWLTATAFVHSAMMMERREHLKGWTLTLVLATFLLTLLGTFMTRSGVFNSVHSFTQSPIGPVFLVFLGICLVFSVVLLAARVDKLSAPDVGIGGPISREVAFLGNNLLFAGFTFTVLLGTLYPLINEVITGEQISVGAPYFNRMAVPIALAIVFLMGVGPALPWGRTTVATVRNRLAIPVGIGAAVVVGCLVAGLREGWAIATFGVCGFAAAVTVREFVEPILSRAQQKDESVGRATVEVARRTQRRFGGYIVHLGVILIAVAIAGSSTYQQKSDVTLKPGQSAEFAGYTLTFQAARNEDQPHRRSRVASIAARHGDRDLGILEPRLNHYKRMNQAIGTPAVHSGLDEDLYLTIVNITDDGSSVSLEVLVEPLVWWIWVGGAVMVLGTLVAAWPQGRRRKSASEERAAS